MELIIERGRSLDVSDLPPCSIALDGYVRGPHIDVENHRYSFDHHENCIRHVTSATCVQVLDALLLGFQPEGCRVYINDVDADTVLSVFLLEQPERARDERVQTLVNAVGKLDAYGPVFPLPPALRKLADGYLEVAMAPEFQHRSQGTYSTCDLRDLLTECLDRTQLYLDGKLQGEDGAAPVPYRVVFAEGDLAMVEGGDRRMTAQAYADGWNKLVAILPIPDGSRAYTIAKRSEFVAFDVPGVLRALHEREPGWGGGSTVGGAPRNADGSRSRLSPEEVWEIVRAHGGG